MKLRIQNNSLRFRVSRSDLDQLMKAGRLDATLCFGTGPGTEFTYGLMQSATTKTLRIESSPNHITVLLPSPDVQSWARTAQVGIEGEVDLGTRGSLSVLIEKDFACLDGSAEENADTFPNPLMEHTCYS